MSAGRCAGCPYHDSPLAGLTGPLDASIVLVGEAPGEKEIAQGEPFVGPSGRVLNKALELVGIDREDVLITNAVRCRPPTEMQTYKGKKGHVLKQKGNAPPIQDALDSCQNRLWEELAAYDRKVIVTLGNSAMRSVLDNPALKITSQRGTVVDDALGPVLPVVHPAAILRNNSMWGAFVRDLRLAASLVNDGELPGPGVARADMVTPANIGRVVDFLSRQEVLACDIETSTFSPDDEYDGKPGRIINFGVSWAENRTAVFPWPTYGTLNELQRLFSSDARFIWHNGKFDVRWLRRSGIEARIDEDTLLLHYTLDETRGTHGLEMLAKQHLGAIDWKRELKKTHPTAKESYLNIPHAEWGEDEPLALDEYVATDADATLQLYRLFRPLVADNPSLDRLYTKLLIPASEFLYRVEERGVYVDRDYLDKVDAWLTGRSEAARQKLLEVVEPLWDADEYVEATGAKSVPDHFNPGSGPQVKFILKEKLGMEPVDTTEVALREIDQGINVGSFNYKAANVRGRAVDKTRPINTPFIEHLIEWRAARKAHRTYVAGIRERLLERDSRVHPTFNLHGTETGRMSCTNPNLQNITVPKKTDKYAVKNMFCAPPGYVLMELDYSQLELRLLAAFSEDPFLIDVYNEGRDLHTEVAITMYGEDFDYHQRMRAKAVNFGLMYGRGADSLAVEFKVSRQEAQRLREAWFARLPVAAAWLTKAFNHIHTGQTMVNPFGRRRRFRLLADRDQVADARRESANFMMQSTGADLTLYSAMKIQRRVEEQHLDAGVINLVHDSILLEVAEEDERAVRELAEATMRETPRIVMKPKLEFPADANVGVRWGELKD